MLNPRGLRRQYKEYQFCLPHSDQAAGWTGRTRESLMVNMVNKHKHDRVNTMNHPRFLKLLIYIYFRKDILIHTKVICIWILFVKLKHPLKSDSQPAKESKKILIIDGVSLLNVWYDWTFEGLEDVELSPSLGIGAGAWGRLQISIETMKSWCRLFIGIKLGLIINLRYMRWGQSVAVAWQYGLWRHQRDYYLILLNFFLKLESLSLFLLNFSLSWGLLALRTNHW